MAATTASNHRVARPVFGIILTVNLKFRITPLLRPRNATLVNFQPRKRFPSLQTLTGFNIKGRRAPNYGLVETESTIVIVQFNDTYGTLNRKKKAREEK